MEGKAKVTVHVDGKEVKVLEGDCGFVVVSKCYEKDGGVGVASGVFANANAETIARAIVEMEEKIDEVKRENPAIAFKALEWKLQLAQERCDKLLGGGGDDE